MTKEYLIAQFRNYHSFIRNHFIPKNIETESISSYPNAVSVKDFGAVGDGVTDDSNAFIQAVYEAMSLENAVVYIPVGKYNFNHTPMYLDTHVIFIGESKEYCEIINPNVYAYYGISFKNLTFNGGTKRTFEGWMCTNSKLNQKTIAILVTPKTADSIVVHKNCIFKNVDFASFAYYGDMSSSTIAEKEGFEESYRTAQIAQGTIEDCLFENISQCAIFYNVNIAKCSCTNNVFKNIGNSIPMAEIDGTSLPIFGIGLGNVFNNSSSYVKNCFIDGNTFDTLTAGNDVFTVSGSSKTFTEHKINANFIAILGDVVTITNNTFKDIIGIGDDRECIYTKGNKIEVAYNRIENATIDEGAICCKHAENIETPNRFVLIHDNVINSKQGRGIALYGAGKVYNNTINIDKIVCAIWCLYDERDELGTVEVINNSINCGIDEVVITDSNNVSKTLTHEYLIQVFRYPMGVTISNNTLNATSLKDGEKINNAIKIQQIKSDIKVENNIIDVDSSNAISVSSVTSSASDKTFDWVRDSVEENFIIDINNNKIYRQTNTPISCQFGSANTYRKTVFNIKDNYFYNFPSTTDGFYCINVTTKSTNEDVVNFRSRQSKNVTSANKKILYTNAQSISTPNHSYATISSTSSFID